ncbi:hypothetical protein H8959_020974 [Pygathrix nigripes]
MAMLFSTVFPSIQTWSSALLEAAADASVRNPEGETDHPGANPCFTEVARCCQLLLVAAH